MALGLYEEVRRFADQNIAPNTERADKEARFPIESYEAIRSAGYFALMVPKEYGGLGGDLLDNAEVCMALAESCATTAFCYVMHNISTIAVAMFGSESMKKEYLAAIADGKKIIAHAFSETGNGGHCYMPGIYQPFRIILQKRIRLPRVRSLLRFRRQKAHRTDRAARLIFSRRLWLREITPAITR
jgi:hypothetical protein